MATAEEKYELCLRITSGALESLKVVSGEKRAKELLKFTHDYFEDAKHYAEQEDYTTALEAIAYAHGFIDAGVICGFFKIEDYHLGEVK